LRAKIDAREEQVAALEQAKTKKKSGAPSVGDKVLHALRHTFVLKHIVNLFITNMSAKDKEE